MLIDCCHTHLLHDSMKNSAHYANVTVVSTTYPKTLLNYISCLYSINTSVPQPSHLLVERPAGAPSQWKDTWLAGKRSQIWAKSDWRAQRRCRSLNFYQATSMKIFWKVIMEFMENESKNKLPTWAPIQSLKDFAVFVTLILSHTFISSVSYVRKPSRNIFTPKPQQWEVKTDFIVLPKDNKSRCQGTTHSSHWATAPKSHGDTHRHILNLCQGFWENITGIR